ncbi:glycosyltransferase family 2 protein [Flavobacterium sp. ZS1P14]|uniref:glycosyltransferase family 2 protein n=1 Tax=Flavobacterium sp. ZS1P14 TaxID=3401729 RepID=UPI003AB075CC
MNKQLTVVITTFNRENRLINQLKSLFNQPLYENLHIVVCDNCSDYNVAEVLSNSFSSKELTCIEIIKRSFNIGMIGNISSAFLLVKTKWMWLLSDDDETTQDSIATIIKFIEMYPLIMGLKFTNINDLNRKEYIQTDVGSISELLFFCKENEIDLGNFIFMSNNVYNMEIIKPYLGSAFEYSYSYFPHIIPLIIGLNNNDKLKFIPLSIVEYKEPEICASSNYLVSVYLGAMSINDIPLNLSKKDFDDFRNFFKMNPFWTVSTDFYNSSYLQKKYLYRKIYKSVFSINGSLKDAVIYRLFYFQIYIGSNFISSFFLNLKNIIKKVIVIIKN